MYYEKVSVRYEPLEKKTWIAASRPIALTTPAARMLVVVSWIKDLQLGKPLSEFYNQYHTVLALQMVEIDYYTQPGDIEYERLSVNACSAEKIRLCGFNHVTTEVRIDPCIAPYREHDPYEEDKYSVWDSDEIEDVEQLYGARYGHGPFGNRDKEDGAYEIVEAKWPPEEDDAQLKKVFRKLRKKLEKRHAEESKAEGFPLPETPSPEV